MAPSEKAQACSSFEERPLVTSKPFLPDVVPKFCSQCLFIQDVLHVHLDKRERSLLLPSPMSRIEGFSPLSPAGVAQAPQDVADRVGRENQPFLLPQVPGKPFPSIICAFSRFPNLGFDVGWGSGRRGMGGVGDGPKAQEVPVP